MTLLTLNATKGAFRRKASHCPLSRKKRVRTACAAISGKMNCQIPSQDRMSAGSVSKDAGGRDGGRGVGLTWLSLLQRSIGLM